MSGARENVFPTRMALTNTKLRLKGAQTGHSLLAKKRDALTTRFRQILRKVDEVRTSITLLDYALIIYTDTMPNCNISGQTKNGACHAACVVLIGRSYLCYW